MVNPYAAPLEVSRQIEPIRFGFGRSLTLDDHLVAMRESPPPKGLARLRYFFASLIIFGALLSFANYSSQAGQPPPAIAWLLIGASLCPLWLWIVGKVSPQRRKRLQRVHAMAEAAKPVDGLMSDDFFFDYDNDTAVRCQWSHFSRAYIFPDHLVLPVAIDMNRRVVLPWRLFASPADVQQVIEFVKNRVGTLVNQGPNSQQLAEIFATLDQSPQDIVTTQPKQFGKRA